MASKINKQNEVLSDRIQLFNFRMGKYDREIERALMAAPMQAMYSYEEGVKFTIPPHIESFIFEVERQRQNEISKNFPEFDLEPTP